jgi:hypothetical protein
MPLKSALVLFAASLFLPSATLGQSDLRAQQEQACQDDAFRLCPDEIPDEARVTHCLARQKAKLSPPCRAMFTASSRRR